MDNKFIEHELDRSIDELHSKVDGNRELLARLVTLQDSLTKDGSIAETLRERENRLARALMETITVLEESRKSFRSKQLEKQRKKLIQVLAGNES